MRRTLEVVGWANTVLAAVCLVLGVVAMPVGVMAAEELSGVVAIAAPCSPTDTSKGGAPCYDKAGAQCTFNQKASTCTASPNNTQCTCAAI